MFVVQKEDAATDEHKQARPRSGTAMTVARGRAENAYLEMTGRLVRSMGCDRMRDGDITGTAMCVV